MWEKTTSATSPSTTTAAAIWLIKSRSKLHFRQDTKNQEKSSSKIITGWDVGEKKYGFTTWCFRELQSKLETKAKTVSIFSLTKKAFKVCPGWVVEPGICKSLWTKLCLRPLSLFVSTNTNHWVCWRLDHYKTKSGHFKAPSINQVRNLAFPDSQ